MAQEVQVNRMRELTGQWETRVFADQAMRQIPGSPVVQYLIIVLHVAFLQTDHRMKSLLHCAERLC